MFCCCSLPRIILLCNFQNVVYKYPDMWVCLYNNYGCDEWELEEECADSAWMTEGGAPYAAFYPRDKLEDYNNHTIDERRIEATAQLTNYDSEGHEKPVSLEIYIHTYHTHVVQVPQERVQSPPPV